MSPLQDTTPLEPKARERKIVFTSVVGIIGNVVLTVFKLIVGLLANSIAVILDAVNSLTDAFSSIITIIGTKLSNRRPDREHPYSYGRPFDRITIASVALRSA